MIKKFIVNGEEIEVDSKRYKKFCNIAGTGTGCSDSAAYLSCCVCPLSYKDKRICDGAAEPIYFKNIVAEAEDAPTCDLLPEMAIRAAINQLAKDVHQNAKDHGWWDGEQRRPLEIHALITSEVAEATEAVRNGEEDFWIGDGGKPEGEGAELADAVIRIFDYAASKGWDLGGFILQKHKFNRTRPYKHGGKKL